MNHQIPKVPFWAQGSSKKASWSCYPTLSIEEMATAFHARSPDSLTPPCGTCIPHPLHSWHSARPVELRSHPVHFDRRLIVWPIRSENQVHSPGDRLMHQQRANNIPLPGPYDRLLISTIIETSPHLTLVGANKPFKVLHFWSIRNKIGFSSPNPSPSLLCIHILNQAFTPLKFLTRVSTLHKNYIHNVVPMSSRCPVNIY